MKKAKLGSEILKEFLDYITDCQSKYNYAYENVHDQDKLSGDLLHKLELEELSAKDRNVVAKELELNRKDRRYYKDITEVTDPIKRYYTDNKKAIDSLRLILGELKKIENYHKTRTYIPKTEKGRQLNKAITKTIITTKGGKQK